MFYFTPVCNKHHGNKAGTSYRGIHCIENQLNLYPYPYHSYKFMKISCQKSKPNYRFLSLKKYVYMYTYHSVETVDLSLRCQKAH